MDQLPLMPPNTKQSHVTVFTAGLENGSEKNLGF